MASLLTSFPGLPRPEKSFNLLFLEQGEFLISSVTSRLTSSEYETETGKLHICTRGIIFQPHNSNLPLLRFKLSNPDFRFSFTQQPLFHSESAGFRIASPKDVSTSEPALVINVTRFEVITRDPCGPHFTQPSRDSFAFELSQGELARVATELETILSGVEEEHAAHVIYGVRYKEFMATLGDTDDFNPEEFLLHHRAGRLLPEGLQLGAFLLTQSSLHFYPLINAKPSEQLHILFKGVNFAMKYRYLYEEVGLQIHIFSSPWPIVLLFENSEKRNNVFSFLLNRIKFRDPKEDLPRIREQWSHGKLSNFQYLTFLNSISNRSVLDLSQYPVFPWVLRNYHGEEIDVGDPRNYRDLSKPIGALNPERLARLQTRQREQGEGIYKTHYSTPTIVGNYLMRKIPEFSIRLQKGLFGERYGEFTSVEKMFVGCCNLDGNFRELIPEFYAGPCDFYVNVESMDLGLEDIISDVELPLWARDATHFSELMRDALESDHVSSQLHNWIDLIFGYKQSGSAAEAACNVFPDTCYSDAMAWEEIENEQEKSALRVLVREFGQCPSMIFSQPHAPREFRWTATLKPDLPYQDSTVRLLVKIEQLQGQLKALADQHSRELKELGEEEKEEVESLKANHLIVVSKYREKLAVWEAKRSERERILTSRGTLRRTASIAIPGSIESGGKHSMREFGKMRALDSMFAQNPSKDPVISLSQKRMKSAPELPIPLSTSRYKGSKQLPSSVPLQTHAFTAHQNK